VAGGDLLAAADQAGGGPGGEADPPAGTAHPQQFAGRSVVVGGEYDAERGQDDVELAVAEGQILGVGLLGPKLQALDGGAAGGHVEEPGDEVSRGHVCSPAGGGQRRVAAAGGDIEHTVARMDVDRAGEPLADDHLGGAHPCEVTVGPDLLLVHAEPPFDTGPINSLHRSSNDMAATVPECPRTSRGDARTCHHADASRPRPPAW
jgi:hypothetical protein